MPNPFDTVKPPRGIFITLLGEPGTGKSSFADQWPACRFVIDPRDEGIIDLCYEGLTKTPLENIFKSSDYVAYKSNIVRAMNDPGCKTIVCESIDGIQDLCLDHCSKTDHGGDTGPTSFRNYQAGPIQADSKYFKELIDMLQLAQNRGKHIILVGHVKTKPKPNPGGADWLCSTFSCDDRFGARIGKTCSAVLQIVDLVSTAGRDQTRSKATSSEANRFVYTSANPLYSAKNRIGLSGGFIFPKTPAEAYMAWCQYSKRSPKTGYRV